MNNKRTAAETGLIKALILAVGVASVARAGTAYLTLTGPPALRVLAVKSPKPGTTMKFEISTNMAATDTNCPDIRALNTNTTETVVGSAGGYGATLPAIVMGPGNPLEAQNGVPAFMLPAQNATGITPQILATYFQPLASGTNGVPVAAPFPIGFVPPFAEPDKSSHAEYIIK